MEDGAPQFIGDGMVMRLDFEAEAIGLVRRNIRSPCFYADLATRGTNDAFNSAGMMRLSWTLGTRNPLNTNFLVFDDDRLMLTYDGGRPWEIDTETLQPITPMGSLDEWTSIVPSWVNWIRPWPFPLILSSAHPVREPKTGEVYSINFGMGAAVLKAFTHLTRWDGQGALESWNLVDQRGKNVEIVQSGHQVAITRDYVVIVDVSLRIEWEQALGFDVTRSQEPDTTVWVIERANMTRTVDELVCHRITVPRECTHYLVDYDNLPGQITICMSHNCATDPSEFLNPEDINSITGQPVRSDMVGFFASGTDVCALGRYVIDIPSSTIVESKLLFDAECMIGTAALYTHKEMDVQGTYGNVFWLSLGYSEELRLKDLDELYANYPYRHTKIEDMPSETRPGSIYRVDHTTLDIKDRYLFPDGRLPFSPQFVPRQNATDDTDGYVVVWICSDDNQTAGSTGDELWIFDAAQLAQGPIARLGHPDLDIPFSLHTAWMPSIGPRTASYQVPLRADIGDAVSRQSTEIQRMFETEVYPNFD
jgi:carotenoid cleavage dioxygenase-like enzyme